MWSIETCTFHLNASYYHLLDDVILTDTRYGHMMFLTKLTELFSNDHGFSNLTESYRYYIILHCISKPCGDNSVHAQTIRACVLS